MNIRTNYRSLSVSLGLGLLAFALSAQQVTYQPYIQPGDSSGFGPTDQMVIAWQTNAQNPNPAGYQVLYGTDPNLKHATQIHPTGRVVDNYLSADPVLAALSIPTAYGAHTDYFALLSGLKYDTRYYYSVTGPVLPAAGFSASFKTRTQQDHFSFQVQGDEGYYPGFPSTGPGSPSLVADYEARIIH